MTDIVISYARETEIEARLAAAKAFLAPWSAEAGQPTWAP